jgi:hypothetical protein
MRVHVATGSGWGANAHEPKPFGVREDLQYFWDNELRAIGVIIIV